MRYLGALCGFLLLFAAQISAQSAQAPPPASPQSSSSSPQATTPAESTTPTPAPQPPPVITRFEVSAGYNLRVFTQPNYTRIGMNGAYGSFEYNILSRIGAVAEVSGGIRNQGTNGNLSIFSVLVGPQIYPFKHRRKITPFAHLLFGEGFYRNDYPAYGGFPHTIITSSAFSWEGGAGVDWVHSAHWEIRLIEVDYAQTKFLGNQSQNNYRGSVGIVYRFGERK